MKRSLLILSAFLISMTVFGQKNELKAAQKAITAKNYAAAMTSLNQAEALIANADDKLKDQFYYLKVLAIYKNGSGNVNVEKFNKACNDLFKFEKGTKVKYTSEVRGLKQGLAQKVAAKASESYKLASQSNSDADYAKAAKDFYMVYLLSPTDTLYVDNAALIYNKAKEYEKSSELYNELLDLNYTGIATEYIATSVADGKDVSYPDKKAMDLQVKLKLAENPRVEVKESRRNIIFKYLADNYIAMDELDKASEVLARGREEFPDSYELLITEANVYYQKGDKEMFKQLLEKAIALNPTNASLYYNVGVMNMEQKNTDEAIKYFKKSIELDPEFSDAYQNIGTAIIDKSIPIVDEMNQSLSDFAKYDKLQAQQFEIYKEALPYYEKAYEYNQGSVGIVQTLLGLYENLQMTEKLEALKVVYEGMKE